VEKTKIKIKWHFIWHDWTNSKQYEVNNEDLSRSWRGVKTQVTQCLAT